MPIIKGVAFDDATPKDVCDILLWAMENDIRLKIKWKGGASYVCWVRRYGTDSLSIPLLVTGHDQKPHTKHAAPDTWNITSIETSNQKDGGLLYDGISLDAALRTSLAIAELAS